MPYGITLSEDEIGSISNEQFEEFPCRNSAASPIILAGAWGFTAAPTPNTSGRCFRKLPVKKM
jgi:hypothetical protein